MTTPILELISANIVDTLNLVKVANGYNYDITAERRKRRGNDPAHLSAELIQQGATAIGSEVQLGSEWLQTYVIDVYILISDDVVETLYPDTVLNAIQADIQKALLVDRTRGGNAFDTICKGSDPFQIVSGDFEGRQLSIDVHYRTAETDPYSYMG